MGTKSILWTPPPTSRARMHMQILLESVFPLPEQMYTPCYVKLTGATVICTQPSRHGPDFHRPQSQITIDSPDFHPRRSQKCLLGAIVWRGKSSYCDITPWGPSFAGIPANPGWSVLGEYLVHVV